MALFSGAQKGLGVAEVLHGGKRAWLRFRALYDAAMGAINDPSGRMNQARPRS